MHLTFVPLKECFIIVASMNFALICHQNNIVYLMEKLGPLVLRLLSLGLITFLTDLSISQISFNQLTSTRTCELLIRLFAN